VTLEYIRDPDEITRRSLATVAAETDLSSVPPDIAPIVARIIHACGMTDIVGDLAFSDDAGIAGRAALGKGAPIICDVHMVAAALISDRLAAHNPIHVAIDRPGAAELATQTGQTRAAAGMQLLAAHFEGAIVVIGNAPTALFRVLEFVIVGASKPALVLGFPVGFVGAAESKAALAANEVGLRYITLPGRRGGSAMAAAAMNALILQSGDK